MQWHGSVLHNLPHWGSLWQPHHDVFLPGEKQEIEKGFLLPTKHRDYEVFVTGGPYPLYDVSHHQFEASDYQPLKQTLSCWSCWTAGSSWALRKTTKEIFCYACRAGHTQLLTSKNLSWKWKSYIQAMRIYCIKFCFVALKIIYRFLLGFWSKRSAPQRRSWKLTGQYLICNFHLQIRTLLTLDSVVSGTWEEQFSSRIQKERYFFLRKAPLSNSNSSWVRRNTIVLANGKKKN